jgi:hypothetical protein
VVFPYGVYFDDFWGKVKFFQKYFSHYFGGPAIMLWNLNVPQCWRLVSSIGAVGEPLLSPVLLTWGQQSSCWGRPWSWYRPAGPGSSSVLQNWSLKSSIRVWTQGFVLAR